MTTQTTLTMEVDEGMERLLYIFAARELFRGLGLNPDVANAGLAVQISEAETQVQKMRREQAVKRGGRRVKGPWG